MTNPENSCYINSALQVLVNTPKFASLYYKNCLKPFINLQHPNGTRGALTGTLSAFFINYYGKKYKIIDTANILINFSKLVRGDFNGKDEKYCHDFLTSTILKLADDTNCVRKIKNFYSFGYWQLSPKIYGNVPNWFWHNNIYTKLSNECLRWRLPVK